MKVSPTQPIQGLLQSAWKAILYLKRLTETRNARNGGVFTILVRVRVISWENLPTKKCRNKVAVGGRSTSYQKNEWRAAVYSINGERPITAV